MDGDENAMSFGQIVPILLLSSIVLLFLEAYDGLQSRIKRVSQLTRQSEQREMEKEEEETGEGHSRSTSSQRSLVHGRTSPAASPTTSQHFEMTGATHNGEDDPEPEGVYRPRRADTEMGGRSQAGRSQASGLESGPSIREPQRRPTLPPPAPHAQLGSGQGEHT